MGKFQMLPSRALACDAVPSHRLLPQMHRAPHTQLRAIPDIDAASTTHFLAVAAGASGALTFSALAARLQCEQPQRGAEPPPQSSTAETQADHTHDAPESQTPTSAEDIWDAAWKAFWPTRTTVGSDVSAPQDDAEPVSKPLLWIQGLKRNARSRLLALALASIEARAKELPQAPLQLTDPAVWPELCREMMATCTLDTSMAWLGYVPTELNDAVLNASRLRNDDVAKNEEASPLSPLPWIASYLQGESFSKPKDTSNDPSNSDGILGTLVEDKQSEAVWYGLDGRLPLYCGVLRLLRSSAIVSKRNYGMRDGMAQTRNAASTDAFTHDRQPAGSTTHAPPPPGAAAAAAPAPEENQDDRIRDHATSIQGEANFEASEPRAGQDEDAFRTEATTTMASMHQRMLLLVYQADDQAGTTRKSSTAAQSDEFTGDECSTPLAVRGWSATADGMKSPSQLLDAAPGILQDMAVLIADAIAKAYMNEVSTGRWSAAAPVPWLQLRAKGTHATTRERYDVRTRMGQAFADSSVFLSETRRELMDDNALAAANGSRNDDDDLLVPSVDPGTAAARDMHENRPHAYTTAATAAPTTANPPFKHPTTTTTHRQEQQQHTVEPPLALEPSWWPTFVHPSLRSTRQLQRFSNRLTFGRWIDRYFFSVAAMYEDRLPLFALAAPDAAVQIRRLPVKRAAELALLSGPRYATSLLLEAADIASPLLRGLWEQTRRVLMWTLVYCIGKAIGLIWKGIGLGMRGGVAATWQHVWEKEKKKTGEGDGGEETRSGKLEGGGGENGLPGTILAAFS